MHFIKLMDSIKKSSIKYIYSYKLYFKLKKIINILYTLLLCIKDIDDLYYFLLGIYQIGEV